MSVWLSLPRLAGVLRRVRRFGARRSGEVRRGRAGADQSRWAIARARSGRPTASSCRRSSRTRMRSSSKAAGRSCARLRSMAGRARRSLLGTAVEELWASANLAFKLCPMLTQGAIEAIERCGIRAAEADVSAEDGERRVDRHDESDRAAGRLAISAPSARARCRKAITIGSSDRRSSSPTAITTTRRTSFTWCSARIEGAPAGTKGISLFIVPKVLVNARRHARRSATTCAAFRSNTSSAFMRARPACCRTAIARARSATWSARRIAASSTCSS